ncbi:MAG: nuclear transport factor 2 family protein [Acidimicrobiales bacterium]
MSTTEPEATGRLARLADRAEITEVLALYCRGVDRCDIDTLRSVYHPDATDDHGTFRGNAHEFAEWAVQGGRTFWHASHHSVHNVIIEWVDVDTAHVESTVLGINRRRNADTDTGTSTSTGGDGTIEVFAGRYVDRFERRDGAWRIAHRLALRDVDTLLERRRWAGRITEGGRYPDDPVYRTDGRPGSS